MDKILRYPALLIVRSATLPISDFFEQLHHYAGSGLRIPTLENGQNCGRNGISLGNGKGTGLHQDAHASKD